MDCVIVPDRAAAIAFGGLAACWLSTMTSLFLGLENNVFRLMVSAQLLA